MEQADRQSRRSALAHSYGEHRPVPQIESYWWDLTDPNSQPADKSVAEQSAPKQSNSAAGQVPSPKRRNSGDGGRSSRDLSNDDESESDFGGALNKEQSEKRKKRDLRRGSSRIVTDAITYRKVRIKNTDADIDEAYDPQRSRGTGTLTRAFPPIEWDRAIDGFRRRLLRYAALGLVPALVLPGWFGFWTGTCVTLVWVGALAFHFNRVGTSEWLDHKWDLERRRAQGHVHDQHISKQTAGKTGSKNGSRKLETVGGAEAGIQDKRESVEWTNTLLGGLWPIIDPKLFVSVVDLLEDIMQASIPSFIQTVRIADLSQGNHPIRIISIRTLPENEKPGDESANQTDTSADPKEQPQRKSEEGLFSGLKKDTSDPFVRGKSLGPGEGDSAEKSEEEDQQKQTEELGKFVNLEVAFAYRSLPVQGRKVYSKAKNAHLIIHFGLGLPGIFGGAFPVWVELRGIVGTMRIRVELVSEPPFVKHATISFMGLPKVEISAIPMIDLPVKLNAMNIPGLSTFISNSINTAIDEYVAPKSLTVDLGQLLVGDDIKKDTLALGAIAITIHSAQVKGSDLGGKSDPYVTVSYAKYSKPLFSTRIILGETEPTWRATAVVLVKADAFKVNERLALQIWDSDRISSDDELGRVEVDLFDLYRNRGKMMYRQSALHHSVRGKNIPGEICYSVGYFPKVLPTEDADGHSPKDTDLPKDFQDREEMQGDHRPKTMDAEEDRIIAMLPSDDYPSGILSIQVHEAFDLVRQYIGPTKGGDRSQRGRFSHPKGTEDATREEGDDLPSAYFRIRVNDETTYQSRVKPIQSQPFFQAGQERFLRDWRTTLIQIIVRDSRVRESDPMLGMLHLNLRDVFEGGSQVTKIYPLEGGIGHGRIRVSLLFRPLDLKLPRSLLGWEITSAIIKGSIHVEADAAHRSKLSHCSLHLRTSHGSHTLRHRDHSNREAGSDRIEWRNERLSLPVKKRFASPLVMSFKSNGLDLKGGVVAMGVLWMMTVPDSERILINMPIYEAKDYNRLEQNFWTYSEDLKEDIPDAKHYAHDPSSLPDPESFGLKRIGTVHFELLVLPGISSTHRRMFKKEPRGRIIIEGFDNAVRAGLREDFESQSQVEMEDENYPLNEHNGSGATRKVRAPANRREGLDSRIDEGDEDDIWGDEETDASAATYSDEMVRRNDSIGSRRPRRMTSQSTNGTSNSKGLRDKYRDWKEARTDLHSRHRGMAQVKAYRSVKWVKDSAKAGLVKAKYKFEMHERNPDIESEV